MAVSDIVFKNFEEQLIYARPQHKLVKELLDYLQQNPFDFSRTFLKILSQFILSFKEEEKAKKGIDVILAFFKECVQVTCHYESEEKNNLIKNFSVAVFEYLIIGCDTSINTRKEVAACILEKLLVMNIMELLDFPARIYEKMNETAQVLVAGTKKIRKIGIKIIILLGKIDDYFEICIRETDKDSRKSAISATNNIENLELIAQCIYDEETSVRTAAFEKIFQLGFNHLTLEYQQATLFACSERQDQVKINASKIVLNEIEKNGLVAFLDNLEIANLSPIKQKFLSDSLKTVFEQLDKKILIQTATTSLGKIKSLKCSFADCFSAVFILSQLKQTEEKLVFDLLLPGDIFPLFESSHEKFPYFYCQTIVQLSLLTDIGNEEIRRDLVSFLFKICKVFPISITENTVKRAYESSINGKQFAFDSISLLKFTSKCIHKLVDQNPNEYIRILTELINEIREPLISMPQESSLILSTQSNLSLSQILSVYKAKIEDTKIVCDELETNRDKLLEQDDIQEAYSVSEELKRKIKELEILENKVGGLEEEIAKILVRALLLTTQMLALGKIGNIQYDVVDLVDTLVIPGLDLDNDEITYLSIECLSQCIITNIDIYLRYQNLFDAYLKDPEHESKLKQITITMYLDLITLNSPKTIQKYSPDPRIKNYFLWQISSFVFDPDTYLRAFTIDGIIKVFLIEKCKSSSLLCTLMIPYFDSLSPNIIKQLLQLFFPQFSVLSPKNPKILCKAFKTFVFFLFCLSIAEDEVELKYAFQVRNIFSFILACLSSEYTRQHGSFEVDMNYSLDIFYHICECALKIKSSENAQEKLQIDTLLRFLGLINTSNFSDKELFLCMRMVKKLSPNDSCPEYPVLKKIIEKIEKKKIGFVNIDELERSLIDSFIRSEASAEKFFRSIKSENIEVQETLVSIRRVFNIYFSLKKGTNSAFCSELKRSKKKYI